MNLRITDPDKLAAAASTGAGTRRPADNDNADGHVPAAAGPGTGADATYRKMIVALGVQAATPSNNLRRRTSISTQVDASRDSVSGVNIDEEMTNMLQFQHAYAAAGQLVTDRSRA